MHAIKDSGELIIETCNEQLNTLNAERLGLEPGDYIQLSLSDTGCGMDEATKEKIFDPFYSTKGDKGTGLGLSQVYGFIHRCGGAISVDSVPGQGTQFKLYFPRYQGGEANQHNTKTKDSSYLKGNEAILVVDDEIALLKLTCEVLRQQGYQVFSAKSAAQALEIMEAEQIDLLISDIVMPDMGGYALAAIVQEKYPAIKIQLASGFSSGEDNTTSLSQNLLQKPYDAQTLLNRIRSLLQL